MTILLSWTITELLRHLPETAAVLGRFGIDTCCGGALSLEDAARAVGVSPETLLAALAPAVEAA